VQADETGNKLYRLRDVDKRIKNAYVGQGFIKTSLSLFRALMAKPGGWWLLG